MQGSVHVTRINKAKNSDKYIKEHLGDIDVSGYRVLKPLIDFYLEDFPAAKILSWSHQDCLSLELYSISPCPLCKMKYDRRGIFAARIIGDTLTCSVCGAEIRTVDYLVRVRKMPLQAAIELSIPENSVYFLIQKLV